MAKRTLFISLLGLARAIQDGTVKPEDLANGLFYLDSSKENALNPIAELKKYGYFKSIGERTRFQTMLNEALLQAEAEGRAEWPDERNSYTNLNTLLKRNGLVELGCDNLPWNGTDLDCAEWSFKYFMVEDWCVSQGMAQANPEVVVITIRD